jgi:hypothetical protein
MVRFYSILVAGLLSLASANAMANSRILISTMPQDREFVMPPRGHMNCQQIPASYDRGIWINQHQVCQYSRNRGVWVSGYWQCGSLVRKSICMRWDWMPSHWEPSRHGNYPAPVVGYGRHHGPAPVVGTQQPAPSPIVSGQQPLPMPVVGSQQPAPLPIGGSRHPAPSPVSDQPLPQPF